MKNNDWGIAMEGCGLHIKKAILLAVESSKIDIEDFIYIEIGAGEGKTINKVCEYLQAIGIERFRAIAVDIEDGWSLNEEKFYENTKEFKDKVLLSLDGSPLALSTFGDNSVNLILIDGDHQKNAVLEDFIEADRIIKDGGVIIFHDTDERSQGADVFHRQPDGIRVREAVQELGLLDGSNQNFNLIIDFPGEEPGRGLIIVQKKFTNAI